MPVTQYIGSRYVPLFADPMEWSSAKEYEPLTIVLHEGNSFTSKQFVPVGIDIDNTDFWAETGNYNAQVESYRTEVRRYADDLAEYATRLAAYAIRLGKTLITFNTVADMQADDTLEVGNLCATLGFYEPGDGGSALYEITSDIANGFDKLACAQHTATYQPINNVIDIRQLGAHCTADEDASDMIAAAFDIFAGLVQLYNDPNPIISTTINTYTGFVLKVHDMVHATRKVRLPIYVTIAGDPAVCLFDRGVTIVGASIFNIGRFNQTHYALRNIKLIGNGATGEIGVTFEGAGIQGLSFDHTVICNYDIGCEIASNVYTLSFDCCGFNQNNTCFRAPADIENAGERITFVNTSFANSGVFVVSEQTGQSDMYFTNCSIDYFGDKIFENLRSRLYFVGCHIESALHGVAGVNGTGGVVAFDTCSIGFAALDTPLDYLFANANKITFTGCTLLSVYANAWADSGYVSFVNCNSQSPTYLPPLAVTDKAYNKIKLGHDNMSVSLVNNELVLSVIDHTKPCSFWFDIETTNDFISPYYYMTFSDTSVTVGARLAHGIVDGNTFAYYDNIGATNLSTTQKAGTDVITTSNANKRKVMGGTIVHRFGINSPTEGLKVTINKACMY